MDRHRVGEVIPVLAGAGVDHDEQTEAAQRSTSGSDQAAAAAIATAARASSTKKVGVFCCCWLPARLRMASTITGIASYHGMGYYPKRKRGGPGCGELERDRASPSVS